MQKYLDLRANIALGLIFAFLLNSLGPIPAAQAQDMALPLPGVMVMLSPAFNPPILKGIKVHPDNPFRFDFILDKGDSLESSQALKDDSSTLIKYFLASLTIPEKDLWVNLSPYEKNRIVPESFGQTEMGRDLLAEDYMLKQITASLIYPEGDVGKRFWKRIYEESAKRFGTTNIPVNTFNKVWIVPEKAVVYENAKAGTAYVVESKLKVMLEQDYLSMQKHAHKMVTGSDSALLRHGGEELVPVTILRQVVIPELTKEVNEDKNFAQLRQVYNSLILATWYKKKIKDSILEQVYANKNKVAGVNIDDPKEKERIYQRYLQAFKKGVFNYIKEGVDPATQEATSRKYFSGGMGFSDYAMNSALFIEEARNVQNLPESTNEYIVSAGIANAADGQLRTADNSQLSHEQMVSLEFLKGVLDLRGNPKEQVSKSISMLRRSLTFHGSGRKTLLELGSGSGRVGMELAKENPSLDVILTDSYDPYGPPEYEDYAIRWSNGDLEAQKIVDPNLEKRVSILKVEAAIVEALPDHSLDYILIVNPEREVMRYSGGEGLNSLFKKIKPGGQIVVKYLHTGQLEVILLNSAGFKKLGHTFLGVHVDALTDWPMSNEEIWALTKKQAMIAGDDAAMTGKGVAEPKRDAAMETLVFPSQTSLSDDELIKSVEPTDLFEGQFGPEGSAHFISEMYYGIPMLEEYGYEDNIGDLGRELVRNAIWRTDKKEGNRVDVKVSLYKNRSNSPIFKLVIVQPAISEGRWRALQESAGLTLEQLADLSYRENKGLTEGYGQALSIYAELAKAKIPIRLQYKRNEAGDLTTTLWIRGDAAMQSQGIARKMEAMPPSFVTRKMRNRNTILVVEDDKEQALLIKTALEKQGYHVLTAREGNEALEVLDTHIIDGVITDEEMRNYKTGQGLNGSEMLTFMRFNSRFERIPVIIRTGAIEWSPGAADQVEKYLRGFGANAVFGKEMGLDIVVRRMDSFLFPGLVYGIQPQERKKRVTYGDLLEVQLKKFPFIHEGIKIQARVDRKVLVPKLKKLKRGDLIDVDYPLTETDEWETRTLKAEFVAWDNHRLSVLVNGRPRVFFFGQDIYWPGQYILRDVRKDAAMPGVGGTDSTGSVDGTMNIEEPLLVTMQALEMSKEGKNDRAMLEGLSWEEIVLAAVVVGVGGLGYTLKIWYLNHLQKIQTELVKILRESHIENVLSYLNRRARGNELYYLEFIKDLLVKQKPQFQEPGSDEYAKRIGIQEYDPLLIAGLIRIYPKFADDKETKTSIEELEALTEATNRVGEAGAAMKAPGGGEEGADGAMNAATKTYRSGVDLYRAFHTWYQMKDMFKNDSRFYTQGWWAAFDIDRARRMDISKMLNVMEAFNNLLADKFSYSGAELFGTYRSDGPDYKEEGYIYIPESVARNEVTRELDEIRNKIHTEFSETVSFSVMRAENIQPTGAEMPRHLQYISGMSERLQVLLRKAKDTGINYGNKTIFDAAMLGVGVIGKQVSDVAMATVSEPAQEAGEVYDVYATMAEKAGHSLKISRERILKKIKFVENPDKDYKRWLRGWKILGAALWTGFAGGGMYYYGDMRSRMITAVAWAVGMGTACFVNQGLKSQDDPDLETVAVTNPITKTMRFTVNSGQFISNLGHEMAHALGLPNDRLLADAYGLLAVLSVRTRRSEGSKLSIKVNELGHQEYAAFGLVEKLFAITNDLQEQEMILRHFWQENYDTYIRVKKITPYMLSNLDRYRDNSDDEVPLVDIEEDYQWGYMYATSMAWVALRHYADRPEDALQFIYQLGIYNNVRQAQEAVKAIKTHQDASMMNTSIPEDWEGMFENEERYYWRGEETENITPRFETANNISNHLGISTFEANLRLWGNKDAIKTARAVEAAIKEGKKIIVEVCCGNGTNALELAKKHPEAFVIATDLYSFNSAWYGDVAREFENGQLFAQKNAPANLAIVRSLADILLYLPDASVKDVVLVNPILDNSVEDLVILSNQFGASAKFTASDAKIAILSHPDIESYLSRFPQNIRFDKQENTLFEGVDLLANANPEYDGDNLYVTHVGDTVMTEGGGKASTIDGAMKAFKQDIPLKLREEIISHIEYILPNEPIRAIFWATDAVKKGAVIVLDKPLINPKVFVSAYRSVYPDHIVTIDDKKIVIKFDAAMGGVAGKKSTDGAMITQFPDKVEEFLEAGIPSLSEEEITRRIGNALDTIDRFHFRKIIPEDQQALFISKVREILTSGESKNRQLSQTIELLPQKDRRIADHILKRAQEVIDTARQPEKMDVVGIFIEHELKKSFDEIHPTFQRILAIAKKQKRPVIFVTEAGGFPLKDLGEGVLGTKKADFNTLIDELRDYDAHISQGSPFDIERLTTAKRIYLKQMELMRRDRQGPKRLSLQEAGNSYLYYLENFYDGLYSEKGISIKIINEEINFSTWLYIQLYQYKYEFCSYKAADFKASLDYSEKASQGREKMFSEHTINRLAQIYKNQVKPIVVTIWGTAHFQLMQNLDLQAVRGISGVFWTTIMANLYENQPFQWATYLKIVFPDVPQEFLDDLFKLEEEFLTIQQRLTIDDREPPIRQVIEKLLTPELAAKIRAYIPKNLADSTNYFSADAAMRGKGPGGIDLTPDKMNLQVKIASSPAAPRNDMGIQFHLDPAQLAQLENAPGFVPVIISIQPLKSLSGFLGTK